MNVDLQGTQESVWLSNVTGRGPRKLALRWGSCAGGILGSALGSSTWEGRGRREDVVEGE